MLYQNWSTALPLRDSFLDKALHLLGAYASGLWPPQDNKQGGKVQNFAECLIPQVLMNLPLLHDKSFFWLQVSEVQNPNGSPGG